MDRICKVQEMGDGKPCAHCKGRKKVEIKSASGEHEIVDCPVCGGGGKDVLITK